MLKHNRPAPREANQSDFDFGPPVQANPTANEKRPRPDRKNPLEAGPFGGLNRPFGSQPRTIPLSSVVTEIPRIFSCLTRATVL
jgi:hypothetical protein